MIEKKDITEQFGQDLVESIMDIFRIELNEIRSLACIFKSFNYYRIYSLLCVSFNRKNLLVCNRILNATNTNTSNL